MLTTDVSLYLTTNPAIRYHRGNVSYRLVGKVKTFPFSPSYFENYNLYSHLNKQADFIQEQEGEQREQFLTVFTLMGRCVLDG